MKKLRILVIFAVVTALVAANTTKTAATNACPTTLNDDRAKTFYTLSSRLNLMSDEQLSELLVGEKKRSNWGENMRIEVDGTPVFVKFVPLTDLERKPENMRSTRNLFGLPPYLQYGVGSPGFGVWRELDAHIMTTDWVLSGACPNFPLLYHWRVLPAESNKDDETERNLKITKIKNVTKTWDDAPGVRNRLEALDNATAHVVLFLEYIPELVPTLLTKAFETGDAAAETAVKMVFSNLVNICNFMREHDFLHFDLNFHNMLTDGKQVYLTDFGLATSLKFELSNEEQEFFRQHRSDDMYRAIGGILSRIIQEPLRVQGKRMSEEEYTEILRAFADGKTDETLPPFFQELLSRYAKLALVHGAFMDKLYDESQPKSIPYPEVELEAAYQEGLQK